MSQTLLKRTMASEDGSSMCGWADLRKASSFSGQVLRETTQASTAKGQGYSSCCPCIKALKQSSWFKFSSSLEEEADGKSEPSDTRDNLTRKPGGHLSCFPEPRHCMRPRANQRPESLAKSHSIFSFCCCNYGLLGAVILMSLLRGGGQEGRQSSTGIWTRVSQ